ncbi:Ig-like domain-containing protein [Bacillus sp. JJ864]|uniref:Ig-like domain-containing protein n=1 Tax=Bacillus sp. JJ864 TaxID=3122975 RepID=UPI00300060CC
MRLTQVNTSHQFNPPILFITREKEFYKKRKSVLVSIKIDPKTLSLCSGLSHQFTATGTYSDKSTRDITNLVEWYSSNPSSAIVSNEKETKGLTTAIDTFIRILFHNMHILKTGYPVAT